MERDEVGKNLRALRLKRGVKQADLAKELGISPAYLNLLEKGQRTMQFPLLYRALDVLKTDLEDFMKSVAQGTPDNVLAHLLDDPLARTLHLDEAAVQSVDPKVATTVAALYHLYKNARAQLDRAVTSLEAGVPSAHGYAPGDEVSDFLQAHQNFFPELEEQAVRVRREANLPMRFVSDQLASAMTDKFGIHAEIGAPLADSSLVRRLEKGRLWVSSSLSENAIKFQLGHALGLGILDETGLHERLLQNMTVRHPETPRLVKIHLANYFAGAVLLPYREFFQEVQRTRYDVERVTRAFESSYEAVAHRMCNLADPKRRGVPLHFLRVDVAGNVSKRYSASGIRFPQGHGSCPKWAVHTAFLTPAVIAKQYSEMPDGSVYFCFARVISDPAGGSVVRGTSYSIGLGCAAKDAGQFLYADGLPPPTDRRVTIPAGISCRFCERTDCNQRAAPSFKFAFAVDEYVKKDNFFSPLTRHDELAKK